MILLTKKNTLGVIVVVLYCLFSSCCGYL